MKTQKTLTVAAYHHLRAVHLDKAPDTRPGYYYVTARMDLRIAWLAGPFATHQEALDAVGACTVKAINLDPWAHFALFGTSRLPSYIVQPVPVGRFNADFGLPTVAPVSTAVGAPVDERKAKGSNTPPKG